MSKTNLSIEKIKHAIEQTDGTLKETSAFLNVKYVTLQYWVSKHSIPFNNKNKISATPEELWKEYQKTNSSKLVAEKFGCTKSGVIDVLKKNGYEVNKLIRYSFNKDFFFIDSEELFYWMGFLAADGCVKKLFGKSKNPRYEISLGLSKKDKDHISMFASDINYNGKIRDSIVKNSERNPKWNDSWKSELKITICKNIFDRLSVFNIVPRKSLTYKFPEWLLGHEFLHHFMRGYFDGDGSWYIGSTKVTPQVFFSLRGTTEFLGVFRSVLEKNGLPGRDKDIRVNNGIGVLEYGGNGHATKIRNFLYKDATVFMQRKYDTVKDIVTVQRIETTPEELLELMEKLGDQKKMADALGCSKSNVSRLIKGFGFRDQIKAAKARYIEKAHDSSC